MCCRFIHGNLWLSKCLGWDWRPKVKSSSQWLCLPPLTCAPLSVGENNCTVPSSLRERCRTKTKLCIQKYHLCFHQHKVLTQSHLKLAVFCLFAPPGFWPAQVSVWYKARHNYFHTQIQWRGHCGCAYQSQGVLNISDWINIQKDKVGKLNYMCYRKICLCFPSCYCFHTQVFCFPPQQAPLLGNGCVLGWTHDSWCCCCNFCVSSWKISVLRALFFLKKCTSKSNQV